MEMIIAIVLSIGRRLVDYHHIRKRETIKIVIFEENKLQDAR